MNRVTRHIALLSALLMAWPAAAADTPPQPTPQPSVRPPAGIQTDFGDVQIENLGIGRTYNLRDLAGTPLKVANPSSETVNLLISVIIPKDENILAWRREAGFRPIPSPEWVTLSQTQFIVPSGEAAYSDVIINIPNDPALYGKKFQADIYSRTNGDGLNVGVFSHLLITIAPSEAAQKQIEQNRKHGIVGSMDYTLLPDKLVISGAKIGVPIDIRKTVKKTILLANSGENPVKLRVKSVGVGETPVGLQTGFQAGDPEWLTVGEPVITVDGSSFGDPQLTLKLPNDKSLAGKNLMFTLRVEPADPDVVGITFYGKIYVEVAP